MENVGRYLIVGGIILIILGAAIYLLGRFGVPLGRLPGDIRIERNGGGLYLPIGTSIVLSLILTVLLNIFLGLFRK